MNRLDAIRRRMALLRTVRDFFEARDFEEVETALLIEANAPEPHIDALAVDVRSGPATQRRYLRTSPELALKRLLGRGLERGFEIARVFRDDEQGPQHRVEFTLLEWYRSAEDYTVLMEDCDALLAQCCRSLGVGPRVPGLHAPCDLDAGCERLTMSEAFARHAHLDLVPYLDGDGRGLRDAAQQAGVCLVPALRDDAAPDFEAVFFSIFLSAVEPELGRARPTILYEWPAPLAALSRRKPSNPRVALRFELYAGGLELANAFDELTDPAEQTARFTQDRSARQLDARDPYPLPDAFLSDLVRVQPCCGIALGLERLLMLLHAESDLVDAAVPWAL
ncbi:MAG: EF-P lysine aminoacylase EpmA [Pseudomonadota bacterium]